MKYSLSHPGGGVGTGTGRIKVGDGTTAYTSLPYFLNPDNFISNISTANVTFTETSETNNTTLLSRIITGAGLNTIIASIKNLLSNLNNDITYQEITYENWLNLTQQEKENGNWDVTGVPAISSLSDMIITEKYSFTKSVGTNSTYIDYTANKPGYKAIMHFLTCEDPAQIIGNFQYMGYHTGKFDSGGYFRTLNGLTVNKKFDLYVLWLKL